MNALWAASLIRAGLVMTHIYHETVVRMRRLTVRDVVDRMRETSDAIIAGESPAHDIRAIRFDVLRTIADGHVRSLAEARALAKAAVKGGK